jgi:capsular polysaccharide biosynthesis protein
VVKPFTYTNAVEWLRRAARVLTGPIGRKRSGSFYIWSRAALAQLYRLSRRTPVGRGIDLVTLSDLPTRAAGASYRELEPPAAGATPPAGWTWPRAFVPTPRGDPLSARGQGVVEIPGGVVFGPRGYFGSDESGLLADASAVWPHPERAALMDAAAALDVGLEELDGVTMSVWGNGANYAHCLLQIVPRLDLLRRAFGLEAERFLVNDPTPRVTAQALELLEVPADRLHRVPARGAPAYRCETLRAATSPQMSEFGIPWTATFLNDLFLPVPPERDPGRRIYVGRGGAARRAVLNEAEVWRLLEPHGFEVVTMDGRSIGDQAAMFASAAVIVAPHGAALANLVFSRPKTAVIELMGTNTASPVFAYLAWRRGLDYQMIMGTEPAPGERWWTWQIEADTAVDLRALQDCLERLALR